MNTKGWVQASAPEQKGCGVRTNIPIAWARNKTKSSKWNKKQQQPPPKHTGNKCVSIPIYSILPFPACPAISVNGWALTFPHYPRWWWLRPLNLPQKHLLVMQGKRGRHGSRPLCHPPAFLHGTSDVSFAWLAFPSFFPRSPAKKLLKMRISL